MQRDKPNWDQETVRKCLDRYSELLELYHSSFLSSSWPREQHHISGLPCTWPTRINLLTTKWDLDRAIAKLSKRYKLLSFLRYASNKTQAEIGQQMGCSRQQVYYMLSRITQQILKNLAGN